MGRPGVFGFGPLVTASGALVVGLLVGFFVGRVLFRAWAAKDRALADAAAQQELERTREEVREQTKAAVKQEALADAERMRLQSERELLDRKARQEAELEKARGEIREGEKRLGKREDALDRKEETVAQKDAQLQKQLESVRQREEVLVKRDEQTARVLEAQKEELTRIAGMSRTDAKEMLLRKIEDDCRHEAAKLTRSILEDAETQAKGKAREITLMAVQRYAAEHTSESTVRSVAIPSDDMKGRIIGREGRNIRAIEKATGVDIIVDDTPGVIVVSCFDKVRQTIAAESLLKLIQDGRIHPARVEEVVEQVRKEMDERIVKFGKDAVLEANMRGIHPKISEAMGRLQFRTSYGQNVLRHSLEVAYISQLIADQLGLNGAIARRCGFLHDIGKAMDQDMEGTHPKIGYDFAKQYGEKEPVLNAIIGHHGDVPATSFYTPIVMAADAVSGARPGARRESLEKYIQRLEQLQGIAMEQPGVEEAHAIQAGREVRVMVDARRVSDDEAFMIAKRIADKVSAEMTFPGEIRVTVLRETRAVEVAR